MVTKEDLQQILPEGFNKSLARREVFFLLISVIFLITTFLLAIGLGVNVAVTKKSSAITGSDASTCTTSGCLSAAAFMWRDMDTSANPCDDFYQYACGNYKRRAHIRTYENTMSIVKEIRTRNQQYLRNILEKPIVRQSEVSYERKIKEFYKLCLHDYDRLQEGGKMMLDVIKNQLNGWYLLDPNGWSTKWMLTDSIRKLQSKYNSAVLFNYYVASDLRNPARDRMIYIAMPPLGMYYKRYRAARKRNAAIYRNYMRSTVRLLLRDSELTLSTAEVNRRVEQFVGDTFSFEASLANMTAEAYANVDDKERKNVLLSDVADLADQIQWQEIFSGIFTDIRITGDQEVALGPYVKTYLTKLNRLLRNYGSNLNRVLNNYFTWTFVRNYAGRLSWEYMQIRYEFRGKLYGVTEWKPTWKSCFDILHRGMREGVSAQFIQNHFDTVSIDNVTKMFTSLRDRLADRISSFTWMDDKTKATAKEKVMAVEGRIGHPRYMENSNQMDQLYSTLKINKSAGFFQNYLNLVDLRNRIYNQELQEGNVNRYWKYGTFLVRTLYHAYYNELLVPAGAMQFPLYRNSLPLFMTYGELGSFMSRALLASVDSFGKQYTKGGQKEQWWSKTSAEKFQNASRCYKDYYKNQNATFTINGERLTVAVSSDRAMTDAIRQTEGIRLAYYARCEITREKSAYSYALRGSLPNNIRMNGALSHMEEFQDAFQCPRTSKMNAQPKCYIF